MSLEVTIDGCLLRCILRNAKAAHPRETLLLLRGKVERREIKVTDIIIPPLATYGKEFSAFPLHMLPVDFSIVGTVHSHPSGLLQPSAVDLNHAFGKIFMIVAYPYKGDQNVAIYNHSGERIVLEIE
ncbi:MAG: Mov34/MPN/PAD-1 family protein [Candidatus Bathyarchaeota archaeon]|nr:MAG: Mov34/MPN/PAD-1 family protein [Candidatus Bathyarchaeota archaeon]